MPQRAGGRDATTPRPALCSTLDHGITRDNLRWQRRLTAPHRAQAATASLAGQQTCGACIAAGGGWCLQQRRCVPDARGMCPDPCAPVCAPATAGSATAGQCAACRAQYPPDAQDGGPANHAGVVGHGRCPGEADAALQVGLR